MVDAQQGGAATLSINIGRDNVQTSNASSNSFIIQNIGDKKIVLAEIDVTGALYPDSVFDPYGLAGDNVGKEITYDSGASSSGIRTSNAASYIGAGGTDGYTGIQLDFSTTSNGGFTSGEALSFSLDMDPNSVAGSGKSKLDSGASPSWDVGGVSGAELIGSTFTITFEGGTTATGQLHGANNQGGSQGIASQDITSAAVVDLTVNGLGEGGVGSYDAQGPTVIVNGTAGETARIVLTKGFIQPVMNNFAEPYKSQLDAQLADLAAQNFPANNAVEFQTVDILLNGYNQDITSMFNFASVAKYSFSGDDQLPLGFVAAIIDPSNDDLPIGPVSTPTYLTFGTTATNGAPQITSATEVSVNENQTFVLNANATDDSDSEGAGLAYSLTGGADQGLFKINAGTGALSFLTAPDFEKPSDADADNIFAVQMTVTDSQGLSDKHNLSVAVTDVAESGGGGTGDAGTGFNPGDYDNQFYGNGTDNPIQGSTKNDWIEGGDGNDKIFGGAGDDYIIAGAGQDNFVRGGTGADIFQFGLGDGSLKIYDWEDGIDKINLVGGLSFEDLNQSISAYKGVTTVSFTTNSGERLIFRDQDENDIDHNDFLATDRPVNTPPAGIADIYFTTNNSPLSVTAAIGVLVNDTDDDGDTLSATLLSDVSNGMLTLSGDGSFDYLADVGFIGDDSFTYTVSDGVGGTDTATVIVTVSGAPSPQTFAPDDYDNQFYGDGGNNPIQGTSQDDWIEGGGGNDKISGGAGDDYIIAGAGNDYFVRGGTGADIFQFGLGDGSLKIFDWEDGIDKINLVGGLSFDDLSQSTSSYKGVTTVQFITDTGERILFRDEVPADIDQNDFVIG